MEPIDLRAVAFDLDGTLYPNSQILLPSLGLLLSHLKFILAFEKARKELRALGMVENFHEKQAQLVAKELGIKPVAAERLIEEKVYTGWFRHFKNFKIYEGVKSFIQSCRALGLKTAVMSDFPIRSRLDDLGLGGLWDVSFSSEDVGALKPHVRCFQELSSRLNVKESQILYIGNDYEYDVVGAKAAGLWAAHLTKKYRQGSLADVSFARYPQLSEWFQRVFSFNA